MARIVDNSDAAHRIDAAIQKWQQGDAALDEGWVFHVADPKAALTDEAAESEEEGPLAIPSKVEGLVVVSQTCDVVRKCVDRRIFWENYHGDADIEGDDDDVGLVLAMRNALPALLRVARAAAEFADDVFDYRFGGKTPCVDIGQLVSKWIDIRVEITKWSELRAALAELRGTDG